MIIKNDSGREFFVRVVNKGDKYGREDCLTHDEDKPMIEFYDHTYANRGFSSRGQFVSRYYASTLAIKSDNGLNLQGDVPEWSIDFDSLKPVVSLARVLVK